ncbi:MAG: hypothetical protein KatS3mg102_0555 [Planctomycetota bacterium]|nr:MAG: hypothetical protein KatS3mg102_0555 [Planctomycetota bacterium]
MQPPLASELIARSRQLAEILSARGTEYAFIGGLAMNAWTIPVPTYDIDLCAELEPDDVPALLEELEAGGFVPPPTSWIDAVGPARFRELTVHFPYGSGLRPVDIYLATDAFQREALARRRGVELDAGFFAYVATPEDLLVYNLLAWRPKDRSAIERLLLVQRDLDWDCVRGWSARFGVEDRLREALSEAGLAA